MATDRGRGIESALLDAVDAELERRGLVPGWLQLYRVTGR